MGAYLLDRREAALIGRVAAVLAVAAAGPAAADHPAMAMTRGRREAVPEVKASMATAVAIREAATAAQALAPHHRRTGRTDVGEEADVTNALNRSSRGSSLNQASTGGGSKYIYRTSSRHQADQTTRH